MPKISLEENVKNKILAIVVASGVGNWVARRQLLIPT